MNTTNEHPEPVAIVATAGRLSEAHREARLLSRCGVRARGFGDRVSALLWEAGERALFEADREWRAARSEQGGRHHG